MRIDFEKQKQLQHQKTSWKIKQTKTIEKWRRNKAGGENMLMKTIGKTKRNEKHQ